MSKEFQDIQFLQVSAFFLPCPGIRDENPCDSPNILFAFGIKIDCSDLLFNHHPIP